jgi:predicted ribosome quality control (RQC) complex YloA/Tae2 family protein
MTLDEAIKHCEEVAEKNETKGKMIQNNFSKLRREQKQEIDSCLECAKEHRQLAKWLRELKNYQRGIEKIKELKDGFNQIPLSLEASVLESALEFLGEEGKKALEQQPRPRGKWIHWTDDYKDYVTCSCCEYGEEGEVLLSDKTPFCPICGADMREGAE